MKLCVDCKHIGKRRDPHWSGVDFTLLTCRAVEGWESAIMGGPMEAPDASVVRVSPLCGWHEAKLWEPRTE